MSDETVKLDTAALDIVVDLERQLAESRVELAAAKKERDEALEQSDANVRHASALVSDKARLEFSRMRLEADKGSRPSLRRKGKYGLGTTRIAARHRRSSIRTHFNHPSHCRTSWRIGR